MTGTRPGGVPESRSRYRWVVLAVLWLTLVLSYFDRVSIAAALPFMSKELGLSASVAGLVTGALFLSYTIVQVPAGRLSDRWGQRRFIAAAIAWWTVFSVLTGLAAGSLIALLAVRFLMGAGEGFHPPPLWRTLANWFGSGRRSIPLAIMLTALPLGPALAPKITFPIIQSFGWRWVFYGTLVPGVVIVVLALWLLRDTPTRRDAPERGAPSTTIRTARTYKVPGHVLLAFAAFFCFGFVLYGLMGWLPTYLLTYRHLDLKQAGWLATSPYLAGAVGLLLGAWLCQSRFNHQRRRFIAATYLATALCIGLTAAADSMLGAGIGLTAAGFFLYAGLGPFWSVPMDLVSPQEVGTWLGLINMGTQISGFLGPLYIGWLIQTTGSFTPALVSMIVAMVLGAAVLLAMRDRGAEPAAVAGVDELRQAPAAP
ncbi:MFS transporter [Kribbella sp. NBC_00709]|uniref:MFS transporter n=1 Tax=Kribbella sp. NBC_00709 TaxID=2975972 RepID=UPI002E28C707|nr:MFS transporter [Kribbella sp. NBC_00709]